MPTSHPSSQPLSDRVAVVSEALSAWDLDAIAELLVAHDVTGIEPTVGPDGHLSQERPAAARAAVERIDARGVGLCGLAATSALPLGHAGLARVVELAAELGAPAVRIFAPAFERGRGADAQLESAARALEARSAWPAPTAYVLIEPAQGTIIPSPELARRVLDAVGAPRAGIVYDPANMAIEGHLQAPFAVDLLAPFVRHVHVKNHVRERRADAWRTVPTGLADGLVDWPQTFDSLHAADYAGWFSIDHLAGPPSAAQLGADVSTLRTLMHAAAG